MLKALEQVMHLQDLDSRIEAARERVATIEALLHDRSEYESARRRHQEATQPLRQLDADQKDQELRAGTARSQLVEVEGKLYGGRVSSPRELDDLQKRGADLRRQISATDERLLTLMEALEQATATASEAETHLRDVVAARKTLETDLLAERKSLVADVRQLTSERDGVRAEADAATLRQYDRLRSTRGGLAVAEVKQRTCQGCRVQLTAAYEQRLRHGDQLVTCQSCGRILYLSN
jgi:predicted  nucleic acid-binding Zn-ribbon protein